MALSPLLFFRVAATAELPARESFALGAHEFAHHAAASRTFGSDDYEAPATSTKRLTTTHTPTIIHNGKFDRARNSGYGRKC